MKATLVAALALALIALPAHSAEQTPEAYGPYAFGVSRVRIPMPLDPNGPEGVFPAVDADLYVPQGAGPRPLIELGHAWPGTNSEFPLSGWGKRLASRGFVVIIADRRAGTATSEMQGFRQLAD